MSLRKPIGQENDTEDVWLCSSHGFNQIVCLHKGVIEWYSKSIVICDDCTFLWVKNNVFSSDSALIAAFEKTKKKYQGKLKKLEFQIQALTERYEAQVMGVKEGQLPLLSL